MLLQLKGMFELSGFEYRYFTVVLEGKPIKIIQNDGDITLDWASCTLLYLPESLKYIIYEQIKFHAQLN